MNKGRKHPFCNSWKLKIISKRYHLESEKVQYKLAENIGKSIFNKGVVYRDINKCYD